MKKGVNSQRVRSLSVVVLSERNLKRKKRRSLMILNGSGLRKKKESEQKRNEGDVKRGKGGN